MILPEAGSTIDAFGKARVAFKWEQVQDPSGISYIVEVSRMPDFSTIIFHKDSLEQNSYMLAENEALVSGPYYWRVRAQDGAGNESAWSTPQAFSVGGVDVMLLLAGILVAAVIVGLVVWRIVHVTRKEGWR
jgi:hypothetical protein